jgi:hypothetical protein
MQSCGKQARAQLTLEEKRNLNDPSEELVNGCLLKGMSTAMLSSYPYQKDRHDGDDRT